MKIINLSEGNSLLNQYVAELRDVHVQNDRMRFRRNIERIGEIMAYEMSKALTYSVKQVQTPLGTATASTHDDKIVIATVFRAGLPLHTGFLNMFDHADNAFVSAFRFYKDDEHRIVDVHIEYIAAPSLNDKTLLLVDPMLATGESMELAWKALLTKGTPAKLQMACVIASRQGVEHMAKLFPGDDITLWCAQIHCSGAGRCRRLVVWRETLTSDCHKSQMVSNRQPSRCSLLTIYYFRRYVKK